MESQHEDRCNCKSDDSRLPKPQFPLLDQLSFNPASQDPSSSSPGPFSATRTGRDEVPKLTREVLNQDLIMVSYFSGTQHLSDGLLEWMKLYVRLQSWNQGNEDALTPDDLVIVENPGLIPILPTLRKKPRSERDGLASRPGSMNQQLQRHNYKRAETSTTPVLFSDCNNPTAKLQCVPKTAATLATTDIAGTTTKAGYPALMPSSTSLVPLKQMALSLIISLANTENSGQKTAGTEPESETDFTPEHKPEPATKRVSPPARSQNLEHEQFNEKWKLTKENIDKDVDMSIYRQRAIEPITAELDLIAETKPEPTVKPVFIPESMHAQKVTPITISESTQKLETAPRDDNSNLSNKETTISTTEGLYKLHTQKPATTAPVLSAKTIPESMTTTECAPGLQSAKKLKLGSIDTKWKQSKDLNEVGQIPVLEFINGLHAYKPVTAKPAARAKTKPEPSTECTSVSESALKIETASINTIYKKLKKKVKEAIKRDKATKQRHSDFVRRHQAKISSMEDKITASEFLYGFIANMSATKPETKPEPSNKSAYVSENTLHLDPTPIDTKQTHWNKEEKNETDKIFASEFYRLSNQTSATEKPATKTSPAPESTIENAPVSESALIIEPAPTDTEGNLSKEEMTKEINTQNSEAPLSAAKRRPHVSARKRKKDKLMESEFISRLIANMSAIKPETKPEPTTKRAYVSENTLHLDPTPIDTKQTHCNKEDINETDKISASEFIYRLSNQTSATEKPATKTKTAPEFTTEDAPVSESALIIEPAPIDTEEKISKEEMNKMFNTQNGEAPPSAAKRKPHVSARKRKKDKLMESEFISRLIANMSATKPETKPEPTTKRAYVSENTLHLDPTPIDTKQTHCNKEDINETDKIYASEFIYRLSNQTSATEKPATKTKTAPEFTTEDAPVSESALKIEPAPIDTEGKLSKEEMNKVINTQNGEAPLSAAKRRPPVSARKRKKDKLMESEFISRLIANMSATKPEMKPEPTTKRAYVSENTLHLDPTPIETKQTHWNEEVINQIHKLFASEFTYRLSNQTSATEKPAIKTKTTPEFATIGAPVYESALKIEPALIDTEGKLSKEEMNKVINTQNDEAPPSVAKQRPRVSARRRKKDKITEAEFMFRLNAHIMSTTKAETKPELIPENNAVLQNAQILPATSPYENTKLLKEEAISETVVMSTSGSCKRIRFNIPAATETKLEPEIESAPVLESMQNVEPSSVKRKRSKKRKRSQKDRSTPEIRAAPASPSPDCETYSTHFEKVRVTYYDYFKFLEHELDKITETDNDC